MIKAMYKYELAALAGVSRKTFSRWVKKHQAEFSAMGVGAKTQLLPPKAVKFVMENYIVDL